MLEFDILSWGKVVYLSESSLNEVKEIMEHCMLTGAERSDLERALEGLAVDHVRIREIYLSHFSELMDAQKRVRLKNVLLKFKHE